MFHLMKENIGLVFLGIFLLIQILFILAVCSAVSFEFYKLGYWLMGHLKATVWWIIGTTMLCWALGYIYKKGV